MSADVTLRCQYASCLTDYSSEYGTQGSSTYDASNVLGAPGSYINGSTYGDHVSSLVFRTYGHYWNILPFHKQYPPVGHQPDWFAASDFIELQFDEAVYPTDIRVYETFCPGGLVRILISDLGTEIPEGTPHLSRWKLLWSGSSFKGEHIYTVATPKLPKHNKNSFATRRLRLEFNDKLAEYYHELDAVELVGHPWTRGIKASEYLKKRIKKAVSVSVPTDLLKNLKIDVVKQVPQQKTDVEPNGAQSDEPEIKVNYFDKLPHELIEIIIGYVKDLGHRAQVARVCSLFHKIVTDETAIKELNLKPFYTKITGDALFKITSCYSLAITKLDLSWIGYEHGRINGKLAIEGIKSLSNLEELRCRNCHSFVHDRFLSYLPVHCPKLKLLDLFRCKDFSLSTLKPLKNLEYLDISQCSDVVYRGHVHLESEDPEESFFASCQKMKWFFMGRSSHHMFGSQPWTGTIAELITRDMIENCKEIHGVNFWRQRGIGRIFPEFIRKFGSTLKYLDLGWTGLHQSHASVDPKNFWALLLGSCPKLEYLALTSVNIRMDDEDMAKFAKYCPNLEQLDLLGVRGFSDIGLHELLSGCKNMKFLDLSYGKTSVETVAQLQEVYPHCDIKHVPTILDANKALRRARGLDPDDLDRREPTDEYVF